MVVSGKVDGDLCALHHLVITKSGRVNGNLNGGMITIEEGSSYQGKVNVNGPEEESPQPETIENPEPAKAEPLFQEV